MLEAEDYRAFLKAAFDILKEHQASFSLQSFANKAGFSSKSFARDVISGRKRITPRSIDGFKKGLGLTGRLATYFTLLVAQTESDIKHGNLNEAQMQKKLQSLKLQLAEQESSSSEQGHVYSEKLWPYLYAALGSLERGATLDEVSSRLGLNEDSCKSELEKRS